MTTLYLTPEHEPPSRDDYVNLFAQFVATILSTGKAQITVPHELRHPLWDEAQRAGKQLVIAKDVQEGKRQTVYTVVVL